MSLLQRYVQIYNIVIDSMKKSLTESELAVLVKPDAQNSNVHNMILYCIPPMRNQIIEYEIQHNEIIEKNNTRLMQLFIDNVSQSSIYNQDPELLKYF